MPRATVIIPTFNRARYLREAIDSVATQDFPGTLVVIADNASEDNTFEVSARAITQYGSDRVEYVRRETNVGWTANFNLALEAVRTDFALVLGDDDLLLPGYLSRAVAALDATPSAGFVHAPCETIDVDGVKLEVMIDRTNGLAADIVETGAEFIERSMPWGTRVYTQTALIRRAAYPKVLWDPDDGLIADSFLWLRIAIDWDVAYLAAPGGQRRVHPDTLSTGFGDLLTTDYLMEPDAAVRLREGKLRFIEANEAELVDPPALRRAATRGFRHDLAAFDQAMAGRSRSAGVRGLARSVRVAPSVLLEPRAWRALAKVVLGPRLSRRLGRG